MAPLRKIAIVLHEHDRYPRVRFHLIWELADFWERRGIAVEVVKGVARRVEADLVFPHVDLTVLPDAYAEYFESYPRVVNRHVRDVSKRSLSAHLVCPGDGYSGPVIVKTDRNCGGLPERDLALEAARRRPFGRLRARLLKTSDRWARRSLRSVRTFDEGTYRIFESVDDVPRGVFENQALVVERFLPERDGRHYCWRSYVFLGDRCSSARNLSRVPVVKGHTVVGREDIPVHEEILAARRRLGFDFGKFDYVVHDGRAVLLDVTGTVGTAPRVVDGHSITHAHLADGIHAVWNAGADS